VIHAASSSTGSFEEASDQLNALSEVQVSAKRIGRLVTRIGTERIAPPERPRPDVESITTWVSE